MGGALQRLAICSLLLLFSSFALQVACPAQAASLPKTVVVLHIDGIISPATSDFLTRGFTHAAEEKAQLIVIELDTPGGLDTSMRTIVKLILASPVPVATFVGPGGARAASAGTFILYASHIAAMAPASNLGAATPVSIGFSGNPAPDPGAAPSSEGHAAQPAKDAARQPSETHPAPAGPSGDTMTRKVTNDAAAYIRSLAQLRGRNSGFAEKAVRDAASMSAQEALQSKVIDVVANNLDDLLARLDGREVKLDSGQTVRLSTAGAHIEQIVPDWHSRILAFLANPEVALVLMMIGIYGLFFELTNPGMALPGVAGVICLLLGLYAFQLLPVNWAGVALIAIGAALMIAEAFLPTFGVVGIGGLVAFFFGGLFLMDTGVPGFDLSIPFLTGIAAVSAVLLLAIGTLAARAHRSQVVSGREEMIGLQGVVTLARNSVTYADVHGESWRVQCHEPLSTGDSVRVTAIDGLTLQVQRLGIKKLYKE